MTPLLRALQHFPTTTNRHPSGRSAPQCVTTLLSSPASLFFTLVTLVLSPVLLKHTSSAPTPGARLPPQACLGPSACSVLPQISALLTPSPPSGLHSNAKLPTTCIKRTTLPSSSQTPSPPEHSRFPLHYGFIFLPFYSLTYHVFY